MTKKKKLLAQNIFNYTDVSIDGVNYALKSGIISGIVSYDDNLSKTKRTNKMWLRRKGYF